MKTVSKLPWQRWKSLWDVVLAVLAGIVVFILLDMVTGGLLNSVLIAAVAMAVVGLMHYFLWGRVLTRSDTLAARATTAIASSAASSVPDDEIVISLDEPERAELLRLVEKSLAENSPNGQVKQNAALDRQLADKLRMFGA